MIDDFIARQKDWFKISGKFVVLFISSVLLNKNVHLYYFPKKKNNSSAYRLF